LFAADLFDPSAVRMKFSPILKTNIWIIISQFHFSLMDVSVAGFFRYASDRLVITSDNGINFASSTVNATNMY
jgi:hypothetical protein